MNWMHLKEHLAASIVEMDALHVYAGFAIQVAVSLWARRPLSSWLPLLSVLAGELANETGDIILGDEALLRTWQVRGAVHDVLNTMLLPALLFALCRYFPQLFQGQGRSDPAQEPHTSTTPS
jgi:hypothetical protein